MSKVSKNYIEQASKREKPKCYGKFKDAVSKDKKKCGFCWFNPFCRGDEKLPTKEGKKEEKKESK